MERARDTAAAGRSGTRLSKEGLIEGKGGATPMLSRTHEWVDRQRTEQGAHQQGLGEQQSSGEEESKSTDGELQGAQGIYTLDKKAAGSDELPAAGMSTHEIALAHAPAFAMTAPAARGGPQTPAGIPKAAQEARLRVARRIAHRIE